MEPMVRKLQQLALIVLSSPGHPNLRTMRRSPLNFVEQHLGSSVLLVSLRSLFVVSRERRSVKKSYASLKQTRISHYIAQSRPFRISFHSDGYETAAAAAGTDESSGGNKGFKLRYYQLSC